MGRKSNKKDGIDFVYCIYCGNVCRKGKNESWNWYYKRKYCSNECQIKHRSQMRTRKIKCSYCGNEIIRKLWDIKNSNGRLFCDYNCFLKYKKKVNNTNVICDNCSKHFKKKNNQMFTKRNFCSRKCMGLWQSKNWIGKDSPGYVNGNCSLYHSIRNCSKYKEWRNAVFERDNYTCRMCKDSRGGNLNAHHIVFFSEILNKSSIKNFDDADECELLWNIDNGITYCKSCHMEFHNENGYDYDNN